VEEIVKLRCTRVVDDLFVGPFSTVAGGAGAAKTIRFPELKMVIGQLKIKVDRDVGSIEFPFLEKVRGQLSIVVVGGASLGTVSAPNLKVVGGSITVEASGKSSIDKIHSTCGGPRVRPLLFVKLYEFYVVDDFVPLGFGYVRGLILCGRRHLVCFPRTYTTGLYHALPFS
jgi:hypothetical protein